MSVQPGFQALELRRQAIDSIRENSARLASAYATFTSVGTGESAPVDAVQFGTTFVDVPPTVAYGAELYDQGPGGVGVATLVPKRFPRCAGGVVRWLTDSKGGYIGAWVWVTVDVPLPAVVTPPPFQTFFAAAASSDVSLASGDTGPAPNYSIRHFFTFTGTAMKNLPGNLLGGF